MEEGQEEEHVVKESATRNRSARERKVKATRKPYNEQTDEEATVHSNNPEDVKFVQPFLEYVLEVTN